MSPQFDLLLNDWRGKFQVPLVFELIPFALLTETESKVPTFF